MIFQKKLTMRETFWALGLSVIFGWGWIVDEGPLSRSPSPPFSNLVNSAGFCRFGPSTLRSVTQTLPMDGHLSSVLQDWQRRSKVFLRAPSPTGVRLPLAPSDVEKPKRASHSSYWPRFQERWGHLLSDYADYQADTFRPMVQTNPRLVAGVHGHLGDRLVSDQTQFQPRSEHRTHQITDSVGLATCRQLRREVTA